MGVVLMAIFCAGVVVGLGISMVLGSLATFLISRDALRRHHGWLVWGITAVVLLPIPLTLLHFSPATIDLPHSVDTMGLFIKAIGYGASVGVAASVAGLVTLAIPRKKRSPLQHAGSDPRTSIIGPPPLPPDHP